MVDALTGKSEVIKLDQVPEFIDGAVSPETVSLQNSYFGNYVHGFGIVCLVKGCKDSF